MDEASDSETLLGMLQVCKKNVLMCFWEPGFSLRKKRHTTFEMEKTKEKSSGDELKL